MNDDASGEPIGGDTKNERRMNFKTSSGNVVSLSSNSLTPDMFKEIQQELTRLQNGESDWLDGLGGLAGGQSGRGGGGEMSMPGGFWGAVLE